MTNTATATGTPPAGPAVTSDPSTVTVPAAAEPAITILKTNIAYGFASSGQTITYHYLVTNTGNVPLTGVAVNDNLPGLSAISCPGTTLGIGQSEVCTATYDTTPANVAAGAVINTATAQGFPPGTTDVPVISDPSTVIVPLASSPAITVLKTASPATYDTAGQVITYSYLVPNGGDVPLTNIAVTDNLPGLSAVTCPAATLAVGNSETCTASYRITAADLDAGLVTDTATAAGTPPSGPAVNSGPSSAVVTAVDKPAVRVVKSESPASYSRAGQVIHYTFLVTNTGNVTLTHLHVTDTLKGLSPVNCPETTLAVGQSETCTASYRITPADLDAGHVTNTATADGDPPHGTTPAVSPPSTATDTAVERPGIAVAKSAAPASFAEAGQVIRYTFRVTNTGNVTLTHVHVRDTLSGLSPVNCPRTTLPAGQSEACTATYRITSADLDAGHVTNTATAQGDPPAPGRPVLSPPSAVTIKALPFIPVTG